MTTKGILHYDKTDAFSWRTTADKLHKIDLNHQIQTLLETARQWYPNQSVVVEVCVAPQLANTSLPVDEPHQ